MEVSTGNLSQAQVNQIVNSIDAVIDAAGREGSFRTGSEESKQLQDILRVSPANYRGARDGIFGSGSRAAMRRLNEAITGTAADTISTATLSELRDQLTGGRRRGGFNLLGTPSPSVNDLNAPAPTQVAGLREAKEHLVKNAVQPNAFVNGNDTMKAFQRVLQADFGYNDTIDGIWGPNMRAATARFNTAMGHEGIGEAISPTLVRDYSRDGLPRARQNDRQNREETAAPTQEQEARDPLEGRLRSSAEYALQASGRDGAFRQGSRELFELQRLLKEDFGYNKGIDGIPGSGTRAALRRMNQEVAGIDSDEALPNVITRYAQARLNGTTYGEARAAPGQRVGGDEVIAGILAGNKQLEQFVNLGASRSAERMVDSLLVATGRLQPNEAGDRTARSFALIVLKSENSRRYSASEDFGGQKIATSSLFGLGANPAPAEQVLAQAIRQNRAHVHEAVGQEVYEGLASGYTGRITEGAIRLLQREARQAGMDVNYLANLSPRQAAAYRAQVQAA